MTSVSSIDTSLYTTPYAVTQLTGSPAYNGANAYETERLSNAAATEETTPEVDLNNYYTNVTPSEFNSDVRSNLSNAAENLNNAISNAVENGMSIQDAAKIQEAKAAYEANTRVLKSTFELSV